MPDAKSFSYGGHHAAGASSVEDEMVIDLFRYCNGVTAHVDPVGGGAIWETVHNEAIKHGLAMPVAGYR